MECEKSEAAAEIDFEARSKGGEYSQSLILERGEKIRRAHGLKFTRDNSASGHCDGNTNDRTALEIYRAAMLCKFQIALLAQFSKEPFWYLHLARCCGSRLAGIVRLMLGGHLTAFGSASDRRNLYFAVALGELGRLQFCSMP